MLSQPCNPLPSASLVPSGWDSGAQRYSQSGKLLLLELFLLSRRCDVTPNHIKDDFQYSPLLFPPSLYLSITAMTEFKMKAWLGRWVFSLLEVFVEEVSVSDAVMFHWTQCDLGTLQKNFFLLPNMVKPQHLHHQLSEHQNIRSTERTYKLIYPPVPSPASCELGLQVSHWYSGGHFSHTEQ